MKKVVFIVLGTIAIIVIAIITVGVMIFHEPSYEKELTKIEKYISDRDYDKAREVAISIPANARYHKSTDNFSVSRYYRQEALDRINIAQLSSLIAEGQLEDAEQLAQELEATHVFWDLIRKNLSKLYSNNFRSLYAVLTRYPLTASYHNKLVDFYIPHFGHAEEYASTGNDSYNGKQYYLSTNVGYNDESAKLNSLVSQIIDMAIFDNNVACIKKMILLLKPEAVEVSRVYTDGHGYDNTEWATITYKLENKAKAEAQRKIKEAGINL